MLDSHVIHGDILLQDHEKGLKFRKGEGVPKVPLAWEEHLLVIGQAEGQSQQQLLAFGSGSLLLYTVPLSKKALPSLTVPQSSCLSYRLCFYC